MKESTEYIYRVEFIESPISGEPEVRNYYFSCLAAIYTKFTEEEIGCKVTRLWNVKVSDGIPYEGRKCRITREILYRKPQKKRVIAAKTTR